MCWPKRYFLAFWVFLGLLIFTGNESVISIALVHIVNSEENPKNGEKEFLGLNCFENVSIDVANDWTIPTTQYLHSAYYASTLFTQLLGGYLALRFSSKMVSGICILFGSILILLIPTAIQVHIVLVFVIRIVKGLFDGCVEPALYGVIMAWAPKSEKGRIMSLIKSGASLSPAVAFAASGVTACFVSWDATIYIYGGCGILWSGIWLIYAHDSPLQHPGLSLGEKLLFEREGPRVHQGSLAIAEKIPWREMISSMPLWAIFLSSFCRNWMFSLLTMGIPQYLETAFTSNIAEIGIEVALPAVCMTIMMVAGGILIDALIKSNLVSTTVGRKIAQSVGFGVEACCVFSLRFIDKQEIALIVLCIGVAFSGLCVSGYQVNLLDLAPQYVSVLTGFIRFGVLGAVINTVITATLMSKNIKAWQNIFTITSTVHIAGVIFYGIFASGELQKWNGDPEKTLLINGDAENEADVKLLTEP